MSSAEWQQPEKNSFAEFNRRLDAGNTTTTTTATATMTPYEANPDFTAWPGYIGGGEDEAWVAYKKAQVGEGREVNGEEKEKGKVKEGKTGKKKKKEKKKSACPNL